MSRWKRVLISFGIVIVACVIYLWLFGTQTFFVLEAHSAARKLPFVKLTPIELTDLSVSQEPGIMLSYFGCHSSRRAAVGSRLAARHAGNQDAIAATTKNNTAMVL